MLYDETDDLDGLAEMSKLESGSVHGVYLGLCRSLCALENTGVERRGVLNPSPSAAAALLMSLLALAEVGVT